MVESIEKLKIHVEKLYELLYAEIGHDFAKIDKTSKDWYMQYYLDISRQDEIVEKYLKKLRIHEKQKNSIRCSVHLGCSPNSNLKNL